MNKKFLFSSEAIFFNIGCFFWFTGSKFGCKKVKPLHFIINVSNSKVATTVQPKFILFMDIQGYFLWQIYEA